MNASLTISDNLTMSYFINAKFHEAGWSNKSLSTNALMDGNCTFISNHHCVVLVIDIDFQKRFKNVIVDMDPIVRKLATCTSLYLVFEGDYDPCLSSWIESAKRLYKTDMHDQQLHSAINEIIHLESKDESRRASFLHIDAKKNVLKKQMPW